MAGQDNSSNGDFKNPVVRLRGTPKKPAEPAASNPIIPPQEPARPEIRLRRRPLAEEPPPAPELPQEEAETATEGQAEELPAGEEYVESIEEPPAGESQQDWQEAYGQSGEPSGDWQVFEAPAPEDAQTLPDPVAEPAPEPADSTVTLQSKPGIRLRVRNKPAEADAYEAPADVTREMPSDIVNQPAATPQRAGAARLPYTPDTDQERIYRRQWWKYDLRVKSKRWETEPEGGQQQ